MTDINDTDLLDLDLEEEGNEDKMKLEIAKRAQDTDRKVKVTLSKILRKNESQLTLEDKKFLKARASYLSKGQRAEYADIINADYSEEALQKSGKPAEPKLEDLTREQLDEKARELGVEKPDELPNKKAVIEAITNAQKSE